MHRIDGPGATPGNLFTDGDPIAAVPATVVTDDWLNDVQEELMSILAAAGIAPVKGTQNQILAALRAAGVFQTPALFNDTTRAATTAFVQRALGNHSGGREETAATATLTAADAGKFITLSLAAAQTITLPLLSSVPEGATITLHNTAAFDKTAIRQGSDPISPDGATITSMTIKRGQVVRFTKQGATWRAEGTGALQYSADFAATLAATGEQKLPGGFIRKWGKTGSIASNSGQSVTFATAFPNNCFVVMATVESSVSATSAAVSTPSTSGFTARNNSASANIIHWEAIGN